MGQQQPVLDGVMMKLGLNKIGKCLFLLMLSIPNSAIAQNGCEMHIFPTNEISMGTRLGNYGLLTDILEGQGVPEEIILRDLPFDAQFEATKSIFAQNARFTGYQFLKVDKMVDYKSATKTKQRLTGSTSICYAELVLTNIVFSDTALTKRKIGVMPVLREFENSSEKPTITKMGGAGKLDIFPAKDVSNVEAAKNDLFMAFKAALQQSMDKFLKPKR